MLIPLHNSNIWRTFVVQLKKAETMRVKGKLFIQDRPEKGKREVRAEGGSVTKVVRCKECDGFEAYEIFFTMDKEKLDKPVSISWDWSYVK